jgi:hypothetical protein
MKNHLTDLNNYLFEQLERLNDEDTVGDELKEEIFRSEAIANVAEKIIDNAKLVLDAAKAVGNGIVKSAPALLGSVEDVAK